MKRFLPHLTRFALYIFSGCSAAVADIGSYMLMININVWFIYASIISGVIGFITAFLLHKYIVFQKKEAFMRHLGRYFVVDMINLSIVTGLLYVLVDLWSMDPMPAKFVALAPVVLWNFFVYKFVVYV